jgi:hypothetical protein
MIAAYHSRWKLTFEDAPDLTITVFPPLSRNEVLKRNPRAIDAQPLDHAEDVKLAFEDARVKYRGWRDR